MIDRQPRRSGRGDLLKPVERYVAAVVKECIGLPRLRSILVVGSFGKGEGQLIHRGGLGLPTRDLDILLVFRFPVPRASVERVSQRLNSTLSPRKSEYYLNTEFLIELKATTKFALTHFPDISTYDARFSPLVWGEDIRRDIRLEPDHIPLRTSVRALVQKGIALIGVLDESYFFRPIPEDSKFIFLRELSRTYQEIATGLCLAAGHYSISRDERLSYLSGNFSPVFRGLSRKLPGLVDRIEAWAEFKKSGKTPAGSTPLASWFVARDDLLAVLSGISTQALGLDLVSLPLGETVYGFLAERYYTPIVHSLLRDTGFGKCPHLVQVGTKLLVTRDIFYSKARRRYLPGETAGLVGLRIGPSVVLLVAVPELLAAVNHDGDFAVDRVRHVAYLLGLNWQGAQLTWNKVRSTLMRVVESTNFF